MPYMSDIIELLEMSEPYLSQLSDTLDNEYPVLKALIRDIQQALKEYEALQIGHMVRQ